MRRNFLKYDPFTPAADVEEKLKKAKSALTAANAAQEDVINAMLPPIVEQDQVSFVSKEPSDQLEILNLGHQLQDQLSARHARLTGICPIRFNIYLELFDELIRQVSIECIERGLLLKRVKDEIIEEIRKKQMLYEEGVQYAKEKEQLSEDKQLRQRLEQLEAESILLKR